jgi:asparagine synthase (glutamine-hydrolysing)
MCGICGLLLFDADGEAQRPVIEAMNRTMVHRGPDDDGFYVSGPVGLAMRRLSIIDLDGGRQPISNEDQSVWVVYNGEIYNYPDLKSDLEARGHVFRSRSDTEVIVHLYEELGEDCVNELSGMFAFALWDAKRRRLVLARDRLGIKPLFYSHEEGRRLVFGSEIKALVPAGVSLEFDYQGLYDYLSLMYIPTPSTAYREIKKLPPGTVLVCDSTGPRLRQYWDLPLPDAGEEPAPPPDCEHAVLDLIRDAVQRHMIADVPIGALLSGGLDSTTVTAVMARKLGIPVKTFTMGFRHKSYDESEEARVVAATLGTEHFEEILDPSVVPRLTQCFDSFDEPFADYSAIPTFLVSALARQKVKVVLTGDGGDEVFAGYPTHTAYRVARMYTKIPKFIRDNVIAPLVRALPTSMERISLDYKAKRFVTGAELPMEQGHYWWKVIFDEEQKQKLCAPDWVKMGLEPGFHAFEGHFHKARRAHPLNRLLYVDTKTFLLDDNLTKVDRMTMANSLEARVPLLDYKLVEQIAVLPPPLKSRGLQTKILLRKAVKDLLPPKIRRGAKKGFTPPLPHWIKDELKTFFSDALSREKINAGGLLNPDYCRALLADHVNGVVDNNRRIWTMVALVRWLEHGPHAEARPAPAG